MLDDAHPHPKQRGASRITVVATTVEVTANFAAVRWLSSANPDLIQPAITLGYGVLFTRALGRTAAASGHDR